MQNSPPLPRRLLVATLLAFSSSGAIAEDATALKKTDLLATPAANADVVTQVKERDVVSITARQGAWLNVTTAGGAAGWARMLNFRSGNPAGSTGGGANMAQLFATDSGSVDATTGAKGINAEDLMQASANPAEFAELEGYAANPNDARSFAGQAPVQAQQVAYLPEGRGGRRSR